MTEKEFAARVQEMAQSRRCETLVFRDGIVWMRAGDLVVGHVGVSASTAEAHVARAYDSLDDAQVLERHELWCVVLVVEIAGDGPEAKSLAVSLSRDLRRSRKIAVLEGEGVPDLFSQLGPVAAPDVVQGSGMDGILDRVATKEERVALNFLLRERRSSGEIEALIVQLSKEAQ